MLLAEDSASPEAATAAPVERAVPAVSVRALHKAFAVRRRWREVLRHPLARTRSQVLSDVSFDVDAGEFFGILGPNGAGKTTLFRVLTGIVLPDDGSALIHGHAAVGDLRRVRRMIGTAMASDRSLYWRLSAMENMRVFAALHDMPRRDAERRIGELLALVKLADTGTKMVGMFSSGMRQRLLIARALLARPRVLLLDEPTRSLDPLSARDFRAFLRTEVGVWSGCTVLLATHSHEEAMELCDRVMVMDRGRSLAIGTVAQLHERFGDARYAVRLRGTVGDTLVRLEARHLVTSVTVEAPDADGWASAQMTIGGGEDAAQLVLRQLVTSGVAVSRFERVEMNLAELIERVVQHEGHGG